MSPGSAATVGPEQARLPLGPAVQRLGVTRSRSALRASDGTAPGPEDVVSTGSSRLRTRARR